MWPWSTIRKLKDQVEFHREWKETYSGDLLEETRLREVLQEQLVDAKAEAAMWERSRGKAWAQRDDLMVIVSELEASCADLRAQLADTKGELALKEELHQRHLMIIAGFERRVDELVIKLGEAQKNDSARDTETGRFTKRT
jgi:hypothetical protein